MAELIGSGIRPELYQTDYSGLINTSASTANSMAGNIAGLAQDTKAYFKQQGDAKKAAQLGVKIAEAAKLMDPSQSGYYDNLINSMKDENTPVMVRGQLGASIQDLLKQNTSARAVQVQEAQMGMLPGYFGGGRAQPQSQMGRYSQGGGYNIGGGALDPNYIHPADAQMQDAGGVQLPGPAGADFQSIDNLVNEAKSLGIAPAKINPNIAGIESALLSRTKESEKTVANYIRNLQGLVGTAKTKSGKPEVDVKGEPVRYTRIDEEGNVRIFTKDQGGNYLDEGGQRVEPKTLEPIASPEYRPFNYDAIIQSMEQSMLPETTSQAQPPGTSAIRDMATQEVPPPYGAVQPVSPQPAREPTSWMAQESVAKQQTIDTSKDQAAQELKSLTELSPKKNIMLEAAVYEAAQEPATTADKQVADEMKLQLLMSPEKKGVEILKTSEIAGKSKALLNTAKRRVGDRMAAESLLDRYSKIQQVLNHPDAPKIFGRSIPAGKLAELANTEGGVYALLNTLKGQDLVTAMRDVKAQSGTAAGLSAGESKALQDAVNDLNTSQSLAEAQRTLRQAAAQVARSGVRLGLDKSVFAVTKGAKDKYSMDEATRILQSFEPTPIFADEVQYFNKKKALEQRVSSTAPALLTPTGTSQQAPIGSGYTDTRAKLDATFGIPAQ